MENAANALLIGFAVFVFVFALSVSFTSLSQAKAAADVVLFYSDRENFQMPVQYDREEYSDGGRTVGVDTVIATIARCAREKFAVKIYDGASDEYIFEYDIQTQNEIKEKIQEFINNHNGIKYRETYVEAIIGGKVIVTQDDGENIEVDVGTIFTGDDGTQLEQDVVKKIYITYEMIE